MSVKSGSFAIFGAIAVTCLSSSALASDAKFAVADTAPFMMDEEAEIALSRTAAAPQISDEATVLVMRADGEYEAVVSGTNGWTCFTGRSWTGPAPFVEGKRQWNGAHFSPVIRAPQCFNKEATGSHLALHKLTTKAFMNGADSDEVDLLVGHALASGEIQPPQPGAMSYMHSPQQVLRPNGARFMPHLMLYTPYVSQADYGPRDRTMRIPMVTDAGSIFATTVVVSSHWSDGTPAG